MWQGEKLRIRGCCKGLNFDDEMLKHCIWSMINLLSFFPSLESFLTLAYYAVNLIEVLYQTLIIYSCSLLQKKRQITSYVRKNGKIFLTSCWVQELILKRVLKSFSCNWCETKRLILIHFVLNEKKKYLRYIYWFGPLVRWVFFYDFLIILWLVLVKNRK